MPPSGFCVLLLELLVSEPVAALLLDVSEPEIEPEPEAEPDTEPDAFTELVSEEVAAEDDDGVVLVALESVTELEEVVDDVDGSLIVLLLL